MKEEDAMLSEEGIINSQCLSHINCSCTQSVPLVTVFRMSKTVPCTREYIWYLKEHDKTLADNGEEYLWEIY